jgi:hypothetical protein
MYILTAVVSHFSWWFSSNFYHFFLVDKIMQFFSEYYQQRDFFYLLRFITEGVERVVGWCACLACSDGSKVGEACTQNCQAKKVEGHLHLPSPFAIGSYALVFS